MSEMMSVNGHVNSASAITYMRDDPQRMAQYGASLQQAVTGVAVQHSVSFSQVQLRDGSLVTPRNIMTSSAGQGLISVQEQNDIAEARPDLSPDPG